MLEYISAPEAAKKWGISERRVQKLCEENRIPGVAKFSRMWLIPKDAEKPSDKKAEISSRIAILPVKTLILPVVGFILLTKTL